MQGMVVSAESPQTLIPDSQPPLDWRRSRAKRFQAAAIPLLGYPVMALLGRSLRWHVEGLEHFDRIAADGRYPIMAFWHGRIFPATYYFRDRGIVVITSENFDGEWIARIIERFGYQTARGSTSRGARRALIQLAREMASGKPTGFAVDGPRGPACRAQAGAIWLAKNTGNPVVPFHIEADRHWTVKSWDRTQVPKPFSRMALAVGRPIVVPGDADSPVIEAKRLELQGVLNALRERTLIMLAER